MVISNHVSWFDGYVLINKLGVAVAPDAMFLEAPFLGNGLKGIDSFGIPRGSGPEARAKAIQTLIDRQDIIE